MIFGAGNCQHRDLLTQLFTSALTFGFDLSLSLRHDFVTFLLGFGFRFIHDLSFAFVRLLDDHLSFCFSSFQLVGRIGLR